MDKDVSALKRLLIIDDDQLSAKITEKKLCKSGYEVDVLNSALPFLDELKQNKPVYFDIILLDVMMPDISGFDVLVEIRKYKNNLELPVIMVTSKEESEGIVEALKAGANDYITKPLNLEVALARIRTQLQVKDLISLSLQSKQVSTINTMVTTLNHEINNPLAIAIGNLSICKHKPDVVRIDKALKALDRITQIVKKIENITETKMEEIEYSDSTNMYKIK